MDQADPSDPKDRIRHYLLSEIIFGGLSMPGAKDEAMDDLELDSEGLEKELKYLRLKGYIVQESEQSRIANLNTMYGTEPEF